jgi:hypothetical protein
MTLKLKKLEVKQGTTKVYNFSVEDYHTYFVTDLMIWTHNTKVCPNPNGKKGGIPHQTVAKSVEQDIQKRGLKVGTEVKYDTPDGTKKTRYADVVAIDPVTEQIVEVHQVGKQNKNGTAISRERKAMDDIIGSDDYNGATVIFHPYNTGNGGFVYTPKPKP